MEYKSELGFRVRETSKYRTTYLLDGETHCIKCVEDLDNPGEIRIDIVEYGTQEKEPVKIHLYGDTAKSVYKAFRLSGLEWHKAEQAWKEFGNK